MTEQDPNTQTPPIKGVFKPDGHIMMLKSKEGEKPYLPVQWRLVWFRSLCPNGTITTEIVLVDFDKEIEAEVRVWNDEKRRYEQVKKTGKGVAVFRATVTDGRGGSATGTKQENILGFPDWVEKAETGAIGRALAGLGYGTQFTGDEFDEGERLADAPVDRGTKPASSSSPQGNTAKPATKPAPKSAPPQQKSAPAPAPSQKPVSSPAPAAAAAPTPASEPEPEPAEPAPAPAPLANELLAQRKKKVNIVKSQSNSDDWSAFCTIANVHPGDIRDWPEDAFQRASEKLLQYAIMPSMIKRITDWVQSQDIGTVRAMECPATKDAMETLTALEAAVILDRLTRYTIIVELAKVYDWGENVNDHYGQLKAIGARNSLPLDEPIHLFKLRIDTGKGSAGEEYREILKACARKNPKGIDRIPEKIRKEHAVIFKAIVQPAA